MVDIRELSFRYRKDLPLVLDTISLQIQAGASISVMGPNGSGKSTLALCIAGLLHPTHGRVRIDGGGTGFTHTEGRARPAVGIVFQDPNHQVVAATVERELAFGLENMRVDQEEMRCRVERYVADFGFHDRRTASPAALSAGERQRLALASILILEPSYLILDEAMSLLAPRNARTLMQLVFDRRTKQKFGLILVTQSPSEALLTDRLIVLDKGKIILDGVPADVFRRSAELVRRGVPVPLEHRLSVDA
jgi:energy-coupling factor transport system ATP-binding protein